MISLDFDLSEMHNKLDVHQLEEGTVIVAHNGFSYTRILVKNDELKTLINKLQKNLNNESESAELDTIN